MTRSRCPAARRRAIAGIGLSFAEGEIFGLLGHNGAGKTTTIRVLTGRTLPTAGQARVAGFDAVYQLNQIKPLINLVFKEPNLNERLTGKENLRLFADLYGARASRVDQLPALVDLTPAAGRKVRTYSSGMKQRLRVAQRTAPRLSVLLPESPTIVGDYVAAAIEPALRRRGDLVAGGLCARRAPPQSSRSASQPAAAQRT